MSAIRTLERILRDDDDGSGQSIRSWSINAEGGFLTIRSKRDAAEFVLIRATDASQLAADLIEMAAQPKTKSTAKQRGGVARAASLSSERRSEIAREAANARWGNT